jgi:hypothetical protein
MPLIGVKVLFPKTSHHFRGGTHQVNKENVVNQVGKFNVEFGNLSLSSRSGMVLIKDFIDRFAVADIIDAEISFKQRRRGYSGSETLLGLIYNLIAGGECLADLEVLRGCWNFAIARRRVIVGTDYSRRCVVQIRHRHYSRPRLP